MLKKRKKDGYQQEDLDVILQGNVQTKGVKEYVNQDVKVSYGFNDDEKGELEFLLSNAKNNLERLKKVAQECSHV